MFDYATVVDYGFKISDGTSYEIQAKSLVPLTTGGVYGILFYGLTPETTYTIYPYAVYTLDNGTSKTIYGEEQTFVCQ